MWSITIDDLLERISKNGFAEDIVSFVRSKHDAVISRRMKWALQITNTWCISEGLTINPKKDRDCTVHKKKVTGTRTIYARQQNNKLLLGGQITLDYVTPKNTLDFPFKNNNW